MNPEKKVHLTEDQISRALVDGADLTAAERNHLSDCPQCRKAKAAQEQTIETLGRMANQYSPNFEKTIILPESGRQNHLVTSAPWRLAMGAAAAAILILMVGYSTFLTKDPVFHGTAPTETALGKPDPLMVEISMLAEEALPQAYLDMTGESEEKEDDEDFLEFLIPLIENDSISININNGGSIQCYTNLLWGSCYA